MGNEQVHAGMVIRGCQVALVAFVAIWLGLVAFGNLVDYDSNWAFVRHVLTMDTIWSAKLRAARAITGEGQQRAGYALIIAAEVASAILCALGAWRLGRRVRHPALFRKARGLATLGLALALLLYGLGFLAIGGEWFAMWQSTQWNGTESAARFFVVIAVVLLVLWQDPAET